jgi:tetratricopeptide (TPR) repeat protein
MMKKISIIISLMACFCIFNIYSQVIAGENVNKLIQTVDNPGILKEQAIISYKKNNYTEALNYLKKSDPEDEEVLLLMANCYDHLNNSDAASGYLEKIIALNPKNTYAYYNLGILNYNKGRIDEAISNFNKAIKNNTEFFPAHYNIGICYYEFKNYNKALKHFKKALKSGENKVNIYYNIALVYEALNNKKEAEKYFNLNKTNQ